MYAQLCGTKLVLCVIKELECLFNGAEQLVEKKVLSSFSDLVVSVQQGPIVSLMINVHHSRGLSTCAQQLLANTRSESVSLGVTGCRAAQEAATVQKGCCGRRASPPSCTTPKAEGKPAVLFWFSFRSPPQILVSGKFLLPQLEYYLYHSPLLFARKKGFLCVTMNQQMDFFC